MEWWLRPTGSGGGLEERGGDPVTAQIYIQETETDPTALARRVLNERSKGLREELEAKVVLAADLRLAPMHREHARERLVEFCTHRLVRHLLATDRTIYAAAAGAAETRLLVRGLRTQHDLLAVRIHELRHHPEPDWFAAGAHMLVGMLRACMEVEREVLLPALIRLPGLDLPGLVADMGVLLAGGVLEVPTVVDVREIPHGRRHPRIFATFARLAPGESFVLVNNHDPKRLRREFEASYPEQFSWEYEQSGPAMWRVRVGRQGG
jgi:uncharacterized protein (DUF2249 family)